MHPGASNEAVQQSRLAEYGARVALIATGVLCVIAAGCSSMTPEDRRQWSDDVREVEIVRDTARVEGCELLGETSGVYGKNVRQQVARMKGNVALITGKQLWWNLKVRYLAKAYRCAKKDAASSRITAHGLRAMKGAMNGG